MSDLVHGTTEKIIGLGGGCHWCTEAVFQSLKAVSRVEQGYIADKESGSFSEAVLVHYDESMISLSTLIRVHLHTHSSSSNHSMRGKYRSAIYFFDHEQQTIAEQVLKNEQPDFAQPLVTLLMPFGSFKASDEQWRDYFYKDPSKPFCETHIHPKLKIILERFARSASARLKDQLP